MKILHKSNKITLRTVTKADKDIYLEIEQENSIILSPLFRINQEYGFAALKDVFNTLCQENCIFCAIVDNENNTVIGFCQIEGIGKEEQSIGITIDKKFQRKGYGYLGAKALIEVGWELLDSEYFIWETILGNTASQRLAEKLGGKIIGTKPLLNIDIGDFQIGDLDLMKSPQIIRYRIDKSSL